MNPLIINAEGMTSQVIKRDNEDFIKDLHDVLAHYELLEFIGFVYKEMTKSDLILCISTYRRTGERAPVVQHISKLYKDVPSTPDRRNFAILLTLNQADLWGYNGLYRTVC